MVRQMRGRPDAERDVLNDLRRGGYVALAALFVAALVALARTQLRHRVAQPREEWRRIR